MKSKRWVGLALGWVLAVCGAPRLMAADGDLDPSFGAGGIATTAIGAAGIANSLAIQTDGKTIVAGSRLAGNWDIALARYNVDGSLDGGFGTGGKVITDVSTWDTWGQAVAVQPDGKIVVAGHCYDKGVIVLRYNADGSQDDEFGVGGKVSTEMGDSYLRMPDVAIQPDGKIVVVGMCSNRFAVVRYNADGSLDGGFGVGGKVLTWLDYYSWQAESVAMQHDGKIVVGGGGQFALARYNADGTLDDGFGTQGKVITDLGVSHGYAVTIQPNGKIVFAGMVSPEGRGGFGVLRYNANGTLDTGFGTAGAVITQFDTDGALATSVGIQADGKIVVGGNVGLDFAVVRYNTDGTLDTSFGRDGKVVTSVGSGEAWIRDLVIQPDGKIVATGTTDMDVNATDFAVVRYLASSTHSLPFVENFESDYANGDSIAGYHQWLGDGSAVATNSAAYAGGLGGYIPWAGEVANNFMPSDCDTVWTDFRAKLSFWQDTNLPPVPTGDAAVFIINTNGFPVIYDGRTNAWTVVLTNAAGSARSPLNSNAWNRVTVVEQYSTKTWALFLNTMLVAQDVGFADNTVSNFSSFAIDEGETRFDNLSISNSYPAVDSPGDWDSDGDSLSDSWEIHHFGTTGYGASDDPDGDGYDNATEFRRGTHPNNAASSPPKKGSRIRLR